MRVICVLQTQVLYINDHLKFTHHFFFFLDVDISFIHTTDLVRDRISDLIDYIVLQEETPFSNTEE
jgi:hypothetical protein